MGEVMPGYRPTPLALVLATTVSAAVIAGLVLWVGSTVQANQNAISRLETNMASVIKAIDGGMNDRYRGVDAKRDFDHVDREITEIRQRLMALENRQRGFVGPPNRAMP